MGSPGGNIQDTGPEPWEQLTEDYRVDFEPWPVVDDAEKRILVQFRDKPAFVGFVRALLQSCENLTNALTEWARIRGAFYATGQNLEALGRIVGWRRGDPFYEVLLPWFGPDYDDTATNVTGVSAWVHGAPIGTPAWVPDDIQFAYYIIAKAIRNHSQYSSVPEVTAYIKRVTNFDVRIEKVGPDTVAILVTNPPSTARLRGLLRHLVSDDAHDSMYFINIPASVEVVAVH